MNLPNDLMLKYHGELALENRFLRDNMAAMEQKIKELEKPDESVTENKE